MKQADLEAFGHTSGCPRCDHSMLYGPNKSTKGHSQTCRDRITKCLAGTPAGRERIARTTDRLDHYLADAIRRAEEGNAPVAQGGIEDVSVQAQPPTNVSSDNDFRFLPYDGPTDPPPNIDTTTTTNTQDATIEATATSGDDAPNGDNVDDNSGMDI